MTSSDDDERRRRLLGSFGISSRHMADELAQTLRRQYDDVVQEVIPDQLRCLVERIGRRDGSCGREGSPADGGLRRRPKKS
ncbi:MAG: NepR family anti-sigma factor [Microvirga sp.]